jgi:sarcosine oxidase gamma subunit
VPSLNKKTAINHYKKTFKNIEIYEGHPEEIISLSISLDDDEAFNIKFKNIFGIYPPKPNEMKDFKDGQVLWSGQGQYFLFMNTDDQYLDTRIAKEFDGTAYSTLQSDAWATIIIEGSEIFKLLERAIPLDLCNAQDYYASRTSSFHVSVIVVKLDKNKVKIITPRTSSNSFLEALAQTAKNVSLPCPKSGGLS